LDGYLSTHEGWPNFDKSRMAASLLLVCCIFASNRPAHWVAQSALRGQVEGLLSHASKSVLRYATPKRSSRHGSTGFDATVLSLTRLMGKGEAAARRELMELHGDAIEVDV
jgi:hypothetical protein